MCNKYDLNSDIREQKELDKIHKKSIEDEEKKKIKNLIIDILTSFFDILSTWLK
jgi:hypothetical protein